MNNPITKYPVIDFILWMYQNCNHKGWNRFGDRRCHSVYMDPIPDAFLLNLDDKFTEPDFYYHHPTTGWTMSSESTIEDIYVSCYIDNNFANVFQNDDFKIVAEPIFSYLDFMQENWKKTDTYSIRRFLVTHKNGYELEREMFIRLYFYMLSQNNEYDYNQMNINNAICNMDYKNCEDCGKLMLCIFWNAGYTTQKWCPFCQKQHKPYKFNHKITASIIREPFGNKCSLCGEPYFSNFMDKYNGGFNAHHITPISEGGEDTIYNVLFLCPTCHSKAQSGIISREKQYQINKQIVDKIDKEKINEINKEILNERI